MTVRPVRPTDEPAIRSLQTHLEYADPDLVTTALEGPFLCLVAVTDGNVNANANANVNVNANAIENEHGDGQGDGDVVGYAIALPGRETTLSELAVEPGHRRAGLGRRLVDAVSVRAGCDRLVVTTPAEADGAVAFYESLGFAVDDRRESFYADGADALRLVRGE